MRHHISVLLVAAVSAGVCIHGQNPAPPPPNQAAGSGILAGRVLEGEGRRPIASAVVTLSGRGQAPQQTPRVLTNAEGRFFFSDLAPGSYTLGATKAGWLPGAFGRRQPGGSSFPLEIGDGERRGDLAIALWRYAVISGRVIDEAGDPLVDFDVRVVQQTFVAGRRQAAFAGRVRTDDRGMFRFANLVPGNYLVVVPASVTAEPMTFSGAIRAAGETPRAYLQTMTAVGTAPMSFDRGEIATGGDRAVLSSLVGLPGTPPAEDAWLTYPATFYPSTSAIGSATVVRAVSGQDRSGVDLIVRLTATYQVSGVLTGPDGPAPHHAVHLVPAESADSPLFDASTAVTDSRGAFTFFGVPPGQYVARVVRTPWPTGEGQRLGVVGGTGAISSIATIGRGPSAGPAPVSTEALLYVNQPVAVGDRHSRDLDLTLRVGARVSGRAEFDGAAARPAAEQLRRLWVVLEPAGGQVHGAMPPGQFDADGRFATPSTLPGRYLIRVPASPAGWTFKSATYRGRDVSETPLDLAEDIGDVVITFTDRPGRIDGTVQPAETKTAANSMVLLFPTNASAWTDYGRTSRRVRGVAVSTTGAFTLPAPPEGEYFLVAIQEDQSADWQNPAFLQKLSALADRIQVRDGQVLTRALRARRVQ